MKKTIFILALLFSMSFIYNVNAEDGILLGISNMQTGPAAFYGISASNACMS